MDGQQDVCQATPRGAVLPADWTTGSVRRLNCGPAPAVVVVGGGGEFLERQAVFAELEAHFPVCASLWEKSLAAGGEKICRALGVFD